MRHIPAVLPVVASLVAMMSEPIVAQPAPPSPAAPAELARLSGPVRVDGDVTDPAWAAVVPLPLVPFLDPDRGIQERTEIRVAYDQEFLYAAGTFHDSEPGSIRANSMMRDVYAEDDYFNLVLDTFNDRETAVWFLVTPNGTRMDGTISNDAEGPEAQWNHPEYNMAWDAAARRTPDGWSVEVRIPFSSLRFQSNGERVSMGLIAARVISRTKERYIFPAIRPTANAAQFKPSFASRVSLLSIRPRPLLQLTPYALAGRQITPVPAGDAAGAQHDPLREIGLDVKYGLSSRLTLDLTVNTDFAQTEVDETRVNLSRFSLFYPERRQFFLERSGVFDFTTGGDDRLFYSRRIGLAPSGEPVPVLGGGRLVGRVGPWDLGLLELVTGGGGGAPRSHAAVVRARRGVLNPYSHVGAMATVSGSLTGSSARAVGLDGTVRVKQDDFLVWSAAATSNTAGGMLDPRDGSVVRIAWERRRRQGWGFDAAATRIGSRYAPGLGFVQQTGVLALQQTTRYGRLDPQARAQERVGSLSSRVVRRLESGEVESAAAEPAVLVRFAGQSHAHAFVRVRRELLTDTFRLSESAHFPAGTYSFVEGGVSGGTAPGALLRAAGGVEGGRFFDGSRLTAFLSPSWNPSPRLELSAHFEANRVWLPEDRGTFAGDVVRLKSRLSFSLRSALTASAQYNRAAESLTLSLRYRFNLREGTDLYVVLDQGRSTDPGATVGLPGTRTAEFFAIKATHTFR